ncbi:hypothetical protein [Chitinimonas lacunae]|uniref:Uncharacterized protein n=1 Tax=Chitinimonas lacunae TaxID=1963018 RepID=A0ABV8MQB0_9NEIS
MEAVLARAIAPSTINWAPPPVGAEETDQVLSRLLTSDAFSKAPRLRGLLGFLVERLRRDALHDLNEYTIAIEALGRPAADYSPGEDPVVRVQMGRLRDKLQHYYGGEGRGETLRLDVPRGSYRPILRRHGASDRGSEGPTLGLAELLAVGSNDAAFALGLHEELLHRLFRLLDCRLVPYPDGGGREPDYLLTGGVRRDGERVRVSMRLVTARCSAMRWSEQFDRTVGNAILAQEELALSICAAVGRCLAWDE